MKVKVELDVDKKGRAAGGENDEHDDAERSCD